MGKLMRADTILHGDALAMLRTLPDACVHAVVTSPPYWGGLRDYGVPGQLGLEQSPQEYIERMVEVFAEVRRVLRADGTLWLNMGDCYANDGKWGGTTGGKHAQALHGEPIGRSRRRTDLTPKNLVGMPWRLAFALQEDGWILRSDIIWHKPNPLPEPVTDRPTRAHEYIFLLAKSHRYYYDSEAIRQPLAAKTYTTFGTKHHPQGNDTLGNVKSDNWGRSLSERQPRRAADGRITGANKRDVWTVASQSFPGAHFATFSPRLIEPCILAGSSARACEHCGAPWRRVTEREPTPASVKAQFETSRKRTARGTGRDDGHTSYKPQYVRAVLGESWRSTCRCVGNTGAARGIVLDPFFGAGTVGVVCRRHSRHFLGIELNQAYIEMAERRIDAERQPVLWTA